ncbi:MAG: sugar 3,4-ketoisomerase [Candidatus Pelagibacter sp.]
MKFKTFKNNTGYLIPFSLKKDIPFSVKRIFIINGKKNKIRADHAHLKCSQYLVVIKGSVNVIYENKKGKYKKKLSSNNKNTLLLKPKTWCRVKFINKDSMLLVFCDREYEFDDYIEYYKEFLKIIKKK